MITGIHHITINVKNLTQTHRFYGELLGLTRLEDIDMGDHTLSYYALPGGAKLELICYREVTPVCTAGLLERGRFRHLALQFDTVDALNSVVDRLPLYGGRVLQPPKWVEALQFTGMLAEDPNGCELEFLTLEGSAAPVEEKETDNE